MTRLDDWTKDEIERAWDPKLEPIIKVLESFLTRIQHLEAQTKCLDAQLRKLKEVKNNE